MALYPLSRYRYVFAVTDDDGKDYLVERQAFGYREEPDNRRHLVQEGDTLFNLAGRYFRSIDSERACGLWWIIADFNGVHDPTLQITPGTELVIPSARLVQTEIFDSNRRREV